MRNAMKYELKYPIEVDGKTVSSVTVRRPKGRDMVEIGDHVAVLARFYAANAEALKDAIRKGAKASAKAARDGADGLEDIDATKLTPPDGKVYAAMLAVAARLADLGDAAGDLDFTDMQEIATLALQSGEAVGRGGARNGGEQ